MPKVVSSLFVAGGLWLIFISLRPLKTLRSSRNWPTITGRVMSSKVLRYRCHNVESKDYHIEVQYEYSLKEQSFSKTAVVSNGIMDLNCAQKCADQYRSGDEIIVYYDPKEIKRSVLNPKFLDTPKSIVMIMSIAVVMGILCVVNGVRLFFYSH